MVCEAQIIPIWRNNSWISKSNDLFQMISPIIILMCCVVCRKSFLVSVCLHEKRRIHSCIECIPGHCYAHIVSDQQHREYAMPPMFNNSLGDNCWIGIIFLIQIFSHCNVCRNTESPLWPKSYWSLARKRKYLPFLQPWSF